ncbi:MAG: PH domain-containing protein [Candidatus Saccharimonadales bacterium]
MKEFEGQHDDEEVLFVFRRHIIAMRKGFYLLLIPFLIMSLPALIIPMLPYDKLPEWWQDPLNLMLLSLIGLGIGAILFAYQWMGWYYSVFIVTNMRLRQLTQNTIFGKKVIDLGLTKIQNISYTIDGFTADVLGYGTIVVQTYVGDLVLDRIHHPEEVHNKLQEAVRTAHKGGDLEQDEIDKR